jgi:Icc-related predicted phosphoesterase
MASRGVDDRPAVQAPAGGTVQLLAVSDHVEKLIDSSNIGKRFGRSELVISCGDLPSSYLEYIVSSLNIPLFGVRGNHDHTREFNEAPSGSLGPGTVDLHARSVFTNGLLIAGLEGSMAYNGGPLQYTEAGMRLQIARLVPQLLRNKLRHGRYLDILVTHAPPRGIHDQPDRCHTGFACFRTFLHHFRPRYHLHGHIHLYDRLTPTRTRFEETIVINTYGFRELRIPLAPGEGA